MKKILSMVLAVVMLASTLSVCFATSFVSSAEVETVNLDGTTQWEYIKTPVDTAAPEGWTTGKDSSTDWVDGTLPLSFGSEHFECYARTTFTLTDASSISVMKMNVKWDEDAFMYLNGEQIWSASSYRDHAFLAVNLSEHTDKLVNGENILSVQFRNVNGGSLLDLSMEISSSLVDSNGYLYASGATCYNVGFGGAENVLDWDNNTCCGDGDKTGNTVIVHYGRTRTISEVYISCKDEGAPEAGGAWGTYDLYAMCDGIGTKIASGVEAWADGVTVTLNSAYKADAVKAVITSWNGTQWANVADMGAKPAAEDAAIATADCEGNPIVVEASKSGFYDWGDANLPTLVVDKNANTMCGAGYDENAEQSITVTFAEKTAIDSLYIACKNENAGNLPEGTPWGTYDIYVISSGFQYKVATDVEAWASGVIVELGKAYKADSLKVVISSWNNTGWAGVAELEVYAAESDVPLAANDLDGKPVVISMSAPGVYAFGEINKPQNIFDGDESTVCGSGYNEGMSILVDYAGKQYVDGLTITCKEEGYPGASKEGSEPESKAEWNGNPWGTYDIYVINDGVETLVATGVKAYPKSMAPEGETVVDFGKTYVADEIKIVITSWQGLQWANVAELSVNTVVVSDDNIYDIDGSGTADITDVTVLLSALSGADVAMKEGAGDINDDGEMNIQDVTALLSYLATAKG